MSPPEDPLAFFRNLPLSSTSATEIAGNVSAADKQLNANILAYFLGGFASDVGSRIKLVRIDLWKKEGGRMEARAVCEIEVTKGIYVMKVADSKFVYLPFFFFHRHG